MRIVPRVSLIIAMHVGLVFLSVVMFLLVRKMPLLSTLGFESANLFVTILGPFFCLTAALNKRSKINGFGQIFAREFIWLCGHFALVALLLFFNSFYVKSCSTGAGLLPFLIVAFPPFLLNVAIGVALASILYRPSRKLAVFLLGYFAYALLIGFCWWQETTFRILTHASLLMTSDLLTGDTLSGSVVGFRMASLLLAVAVILFGLNFLGTLQPRVFDKRVRRPFLSTTIILVILVSAVGLSLKSVETLGRTKAQMRKDYDLLAKSENFLIFGDPLKTTVSQAQEILFEANFYKSKIAKRLGKVLDAPITIWLHHSDDEKFLYTGAKNVHFALPKHREIHISGYEVPHSVLGHELAHIYVGEQSRTILGFPGKGYLIPNLAMTEGLAIVLSKELNIVHDLTLVEQAQALHQANIRVDIKKLFSDNPLHFALAHPRASYIYAGATLDFLLKQIKDEEQPEKLRQLISEGDIAALFANKDAAYAHLASFLEKLNEPANPVAIAWAKKSFQQASILGTDCSEKMIAEKSVLDRALLNADSEKALAVINRLPEKSRLALVEKAIDSMLQKKAYTEALRFIDERATLVSPDDHVQIAENNLKRIEALVGQQDIKAAARILDELNSDYFFAPNQRLLHALRIYFHAYLETEELKAISASALAFLFGRAEQHVYLPEFTWSIGKETQRATAHFPQVDLLSTYLFARFNIRVGRNKEALTQIGLLLPEKDMLPAVIEKEIQMNFAAANVAIGNYAIAATAYHGLLNESAHEAEKIFLTDQIDRLYSKSKQRE